MKKSATSWKTRLHQPNHSVEPKPFALQSQLPVEWPERRPRPIASVPLRPTARPPSVRRSSSRHCASVKAEPRHPNAACLVNQPPPIKAGGNKSLLGGWVGWLAMTYMHKVKFDDFRFPWDVEIQVIFDFPNTNIKSKKQHLEEIRLFRNEAYGLGFYRSYT